MELSAVLFDRDGTLIVDKHYLGDPEGVELIPGTGEALGALHSWGVKTFVVSNQSGIARGYFPESGWHACEKRLGELLAAFGAVVDDERFCPHGPEEGCRCRKPDTGMWESLKNAHQLDASRCAMVGDKVEDLLFGTNAGLAVAVLVLSGKGEKSAEKLGLDAEEVRRQGFLAVSCSLPGQTQRSTRLFAATNVRTAVEGLLALAFFPSKA